MWTQTYIDNTNLLDFWILIDATIQNHVCKLAV